jgi:hypothetical protein
MSNNNDQGWDVPEGIPFDECRKYFNCEKNANECTFYKEIIGGGAAAAASTGGSGSAGVGKAASNMSVANNTSIETSLITGDISNLSDEEKKAYQSQLEQLQQLAICVEKFNATGEVQFVDTEGSKYQQAAFLKEALWGTSDTIKISFMINNLPPTYPGNQPQWSGSKAVPATNITVSKPQTAPCSGPLECIEKAGVGFSCIGGSCQKNNMPLWYTKDQCMTGIMPGRQESLLNPQEEEFETKVRSMDPIEAIKIVVEEKIQPFVGLKLEWVEKDGDIRIQLDNTKGSWSIIGNQCKTAGPDDATMNFGWLDVSTIIHEFCHALGMIHEHQNPYGQGIQWNIKKVFAWARSTQGWDMYTTCSNIVKKYSTDSVNGSEFDPYSIMLYSYPSFLTSNNQGTYRNIKLSDLDKLWLQCMYPKNGGPRICPASGSGLSYTTFLNPIKNYPVMAFIVFSLFIIIIAYLSYKYMDKIKNFFVYK